MPPNHDDEELPGWAARYQTQAFYAVCGLVLALVGVVAGVWTSAIERDEQRNRASIEAIWRVLESRDSLPQRTNELEKRTEDHEQRIRQLEREWRGR